MCLEGDWHIWEALVYEWKLLTLVFPERVGTISAKLEEILAQAMLDSASDRLLMADQPLQVACDRRRHLY